MKGMQRQVVPVHRLPDVGNVLHQVAHLLHGVWLNGGAGLAGDSYTARVKRIALNKTILNGLLKYHPLYWAS